MTQTEYTIRVWDMRERFDKILFKGTHDECQANLADVMSRYDEVFYENVYLPDYYTSENYCMYILPASAKQYDAEEDIIDG
jgi:hypothetical protein